MLCLAYFAAGSLLVHPPAAQQPAQRTPPAGQTAARYQFRIERASLEMPDGVRLATTYFRPVPRTPTEKFPVVLEYLPYRKEDSYYETDYEDFSWFARHGVIMVKVDVRGTGSSEGHLPDREYSDIEMRDADTIVARLSRLPQSTGRVGMWGISWGGFNSIQVAMRRPPALKAIIAIDATDDLFHDDVHYIDGVLHVDQYALQIDHENGLPAPPDYRVDDAYISDRFNAEPWIFTYLRHSNDGEWWRRKSLRFHYDAVQVPSLLIGGQLDGYRDAVPRMLDSVRSPVEAILGPWNHTTPEAAVPGPRFEWREIALRWWNRWLGGAQEALIAEPRLAVFVRSWQPPDAAATTTAGSWRFEDWPIKRTEWQRWHAVAAHRLAVGDDATTGTRGVGLPVLDSLRYMPGTGTAVPVWWNDATGSMAADDRASLVYDSPLLTDSVVVIGFPRVRLNAAAPVPVANWTIRLEDVGPAGEVALVTGALASGPLRNSRLEPTPLPPRQAVTLTDTLHFTTWTFLPGHRIRLAISNAQFPMAWPTPDTMVTALAVGQGGTTLDLPSVPGASDRGAPVFPAPEPVEPAPDFRQIVPSHYPGAVVTRDEIAKTTAVDLENHYRWRIGRRVIANSEREHYTTHDAAPWATEFLGDETHEIWLSAHRALKLRTVMHVESDRAVFHVTVTRSLYENGRLSHRRQWSEAVPRGLH